ncbi:hypothetical protein [Microbacterium deminutum]|uniref:Uncharacterized protein n=1 Tax=Microbacterium deminutum TaxID=344164 RepID=A0ABN2Q318_9MICO
MTPPVPVVTSSERYATALAELPLRTRAADAAHGAIVVVDGGRDRWCDDARAAAASGAIAIVVAQPNAVPATGILALIEDVGEVPIVLERSFLRPDATADAVAARDSHGARAVPRLLTGDCVATADELGVATRDAIGWLRVLSQGGLSMRTGRAGVGLLECRDADGAPSALTAVIVKGVSRVRIAVLGEVLSEIEVSDRRTLVSTSTSAGRMLTSPRYESPQRLALRRALSALSGAATVDDLAELAADAALAETVSVPERA